MSECVTSIRDSVNNSTQETQKFCMPSWASSYPATRFDGVGNRQKPRKLTLADFIKALMTDSPLKRKVRQGQGNDEDKKKLPAWALTNDTGEKVGVNSGLVQLDFDHTEDAERLKRELATIPGVIFAAKSARGNVFALLHADDFQAGIDIGDRIAAEMYRRGCRFSSEDGEGKLDPKCKRPFQLRIESFDDAPYIARTDAPIAPIYSPDMLSGIREATEIWREDAADYESAATAIAATAIAARARVRYGLPGKERTFYGGCDVQVIAESGACKTWGSIMILRKVADQVHAEEVGGLRSTDAAFYEALVEAANDKEYDEKGQLIGFRPLPYPKTLVSILDESGDLETSRAGNGNKAQQNLIRRIACFDTQINIGCTLEMKKRCGKAKIPKTVPCRLVQYRATTPNQLDRQDIAGAMEGGNGRRTIYAEARPIERHFLAEENLSDKFSRIPTQSAQEKLEKLTGYLNEMFPADAEDGQPVVFTATWADIRTARQAAQFACERAELPEQYADTLIYNTALWIAVLRCGLARYRDMEVWPYEQHEGMSELPAMPHEITADDIYAATAIALNSWAVARKMTARGAAAKMAAARTDTEKRHLIMDCISGSPRGRVARGNLIRKFKFGRDVMATIDDLCTEGIIKPVIVTNAEGKNPNTYYELTPEGDEASAAAEYARKVEARAPKSRPKDQKDGLSTLAGKYKRAKTDAEREKVFDNYVNAFFEDHQNTRDNIEGQRDDDLYTLAGQLQRAEIWDAYAQGRFEAICLERERTPSDIKRLMRDHDTGKAA